MARLAQPVAGCICLQPPPGYCLHWNFCLNFSKILHCCYSTANSSYLRNNFQQSLSCILLLYLELKSSTNRPVFAFVLFLYKSVSAAHISHSHICRTTKLPGWPNICSKLGIRKQFCVFGEAVTGSIEWSAVRKLGIWAECSSLICGWCHWPRAGSGQDINVCEC